MPTLIIQRKKEYFNFLRNYLLFLDGKKMGEIANGETKEFEISSGTHNLVAKIDWCGSPAINLNLKESDEKQLIVKSFKYANWLIFSYAGVIFLTFLFNYKYTFLLFLPMFILTLYYLTVGRNRYLVLEETEKVI